MKKVLKAITVCSIILTLSACGSKTASIDGTWYSSKGSAQLVFDDGAFSSPDLSYLPGDATLEGDVISIADNLGDTTELYLFDKDIITTKQYTEKDFEWAFFRSREAADQYAADYEAAAEERAAKEEQAKQEQLEAEAGDVMKYLTQGVWEEVATISPTDIKATYTFTQSSNSALEGSLYETSKYTSDETYPIYLKDVQVDKTVTMLTESSDSYDMSRTAIVGTIITVVEKIEGEKKIYSTWYFFLYEDAGEPRIARLSNSKQSSILIDDVFSLKFT